MTTIEDAKKFIRDNFRKGSKCPCCNQRVQLYKRKFGCAQSRALILLNRYCKTREWIHIREIMSGVNISGDFSKMLYWGLIEEKPNDDQEKKTSGFWRITQKGIRFVEGNIKIESHVFVYNSKEYGFTDQLVSIKETISKKFNYQELMQG